MSTSRTIVIEFTTLDGVVEDPDGGDGTPFGGWAFRHGPEAVAGDKFRLGPLFDTGALLLGRRTWEKFSRLWPHRDDEFSQAMNRIPKLVVSSTLDDVSAWQNSTVAGTDPLAVVEAERGRRDVVVVGSIGLARSLAGHGLVDEYRLLVFPSVVGAGGRLFDAGSPAVELQLESAEASGAAVLMRHTVTRA